jgi:hypothetical protein
MNCRSKIALLHVAKQRLGLSDEEWRALLRSHGGCESSRDLTEVGFDQLMHALRVLGFESDHWRDGYGATRRDMASPHQLRLIRALWKQSVDNPTEQALSTFLKRQAAVSHLRFLPEHAAPRVITALKAMAARRASSKGMEATNPQECRGPSLS